MRLGQIVKYVSEISRINIFLCASFFSLLVCSPSSAQTYKLNFTNETLSDALLKASDEFKIKVAFDAQKAAAIHINKQVTGNTPEEFMQNLLSGSAFDYVYKHNHFLIVDRVIVEPKLPTCQLVGTITDNESGEQLPYATIVLPDQNLNAYASTSGSFSFKEINTNPFRLMIHFIGYTPVDTLIRWNSSFLNCNFKLKRDVQVIDTVIVKSPRLEMIDYRNDADFATTINPSKLIDLPLLAETDIFRTLQLLPGISYTENSSELSIRGGSSDQNLILFDGQTLYNLSHYYGVISALNPNIIKDVQVFKGGFDSRYGERVSGIVDITAKSGNQSKPKIYGDLNLVSGNITAEIPVTPKLSVIAAFRRSYSDIYSTEFANNLFKNNVTRFRNDSNEQTSITTPTFHFYDYNTKLTYRISAREALSFNFYGGTDYFSNAYNTYSNRLIVYNLDKNNWSNYGVSAGWTKQWNSSLFTNLQLGASGYTNNYYNSIVIDRTNAPPMGHGPLPNNLDTFESNNSNNLKDISLSLKSSYNINNRHQLFFGALVRQNNIYYHKDADRKYIYDNLNQTNNVASVYFLDKFKINRFLTLKPGMRVNYYDGTQKFYIEPRAALGIDISSNVSARIAYGKYYQYLSQALSEQETGYIKSIWVLANKNEHPVIKSNHLVLGINYRLGNFLFDAEAYYKYFTGIQEYYYISNLQRNAEFDRLFEPREGKTVILPSDKPSYFMNGKGRAYGIDFFLQYKKRIFTSWLSYSIGRSLHQFEQINYGFDIPAPTDQLHQLSFTNMLTLGNWNFGTITLFSTGRPYIDKPQDNIITRTTSADYSTGSQTNMIIRYYSRTPNYFRMDFSANYTFKMGESRLKVGTSVVNILNTQNYYDINTRDINYANSSFTETNLIRSQNLSLNLFLHFSF